MQNDHKTIVHDGKDEYPVKFSTRLTKEGTQRLTVRVKPVPGAGFAGNNERSALVKVVQDFCEVMLIDGEARWDYHYLAAALARDPMVKKLDRVVFDQPRLNAMTRQMLAELGRLWDELERDGDCRCIILTGAG